MILSSSRRTDIPCYYSQWLIDRLKAGYVLVRNPMNHAQVSKIFLSPQTIDCIVFWTKDPENIRSQLPLIDEMGYSYYFQCTFTPYGKELERHLREKSAILQSMIKLSQTIGKNKMVWRYDPIILSSQWSIDDHIRHFTHLCEKLHPYTDAVIISFVDRYAKIKSDQIHEISTESMMALGTQLADIARKFAMPIKACCEKLDLTAAGIEKASCIDRERIEKICGYPIIALPDKNQRPGCGCIQSVDLGAYNTCSNGCVYCYANDSDRSVKANGAAHDPIGEFLIGELLSTDRVIERKTGSLRAPMASER